MNLKKYIILTLVVLCGSQCTPTDSYEGLPEMDQKTKIRFKQYYRDGRILYQNYCSSCHMDDGAGLRNVIPALANSPLIQDSIETIPCQIKYGSMEHAKAPMGPKMEGFLSLSDLEIAEITTYISSSWGNKKGLMEVKEVDKLLQECN